MKWHFPLMSRRLESSFVFAVGLVLSFSLTPSLTLAASDDSEPVFIGIWDCGKWGRHAFTRTSYKGEYFRDGMKFNLSIRSYDVVKENTEVFFVSEASSGIIQKYTMQFINEDNMVLNLNLPDIDADIFECKREQ